MRKTQMGNSQAKKQHEWKKFQVETFTSETKNSRVNKSQEKKFTDEEIHK